MTLNKKTKQFNRRGESNIVDMPYNNDEEYEKTEAMFNEIVNDMPDLSEFDLPEDLKKFCYIYFLVGLFISYDEKAQRGCNLSGYERDLASGLVNRASTSYSLVQGLGICAGYANAINDFMKLLNIPCIYISGLSNGNSHAWNQVKIGEVWYNVDCTNDSDFIRNSLKMPYFLVSDSVIHERRKEFIDDEHYECNRDFDQSQLEEFFTYIKKYIKEKYKHRFITQEEEVSDKFLDKFKLFISSMFNKERKIKK